MSENIERRGFTRHYIEFDIDVSGTGPDDERFTETTVLRDISGGGARFDTVMPDRYASGQELTIAVNLPGTEDVDARMNGMATVMSVDVPDAPGSGSSRPSSVSVRFDSSLMFALRH